MINGIRQSLFHCRKRKCHEPIRFRSFWMFDNALFNELRLDVLESRAQLNIKWTNESFLAQVTSCGTIRHCDNIDPRSVEKFIRALGEEHESHISWPGILGRSIDNSHQSAQLDEIHLGSSPRERALYPTKMSLDAVRLHRLDFRMVIHSIVERNVGC